jgi:prepilin-type N-terminal cleavage/methylation domain-containing protein
VICALSLAALAGAGGLASQLLDRTQQLKGKVIVKKKTSNKKGFTLVEIMIVVSIIALLATFAIPNYVRASTQSQKYACINNLRQIDSATQQWALENKEGVSAAVAFTDISPYLKYTVVCPAGGKAFSDSYTLNGITNKPTCQKVPSTHILPADTTF